METVLIKKKINKNCTEQEVQRIVKLYSGTLIQVEEESDGMILHIVAPATWSTILLQNVLLPYRYI